MALTPRSHKRWLRKRNLTTIAFAFENVLIGSEFSLTFLTLWLYLEQLVKPSNPKVYYSIISAAYMIGSMSFSVILGRLVDRYRNVRTTFLILNAFVVIGNVIYTLQFSPICLVVGRLLSGMGGPLRSVVSGELARCYPKKELSRKLSIMGMAYSIGFVAGPGVNFIFKHVDIFIGEWHITYVNAPGVLLAFMFGISVIMSFFMVFDLSKENDLKAALEDENHAKVSNHIFTDNKTENDCEDISAAAPIPPNGYINPSYLSLNCEPQNAVKADNERDIDKSSSAIDSKISVSYFQVNENTPLIHIYNNTGKQSTLLKETNQKQVDPMPSIKKVIKELMSHFDTCLLLLAAFFENYFVVSFDIWFPLLIIDVMKWSITELNIVIFGTGICCIGACILMICKPFSDSIIYNVAICTTFSIIFMEGTFMFLAHFNSCLPLNIILWVLFDLFYCFLVITEEVFLVGCLAKMVSSRIQTFVDSIRLSMYRLGGLTALATSALVFDWILIVGPVHIAIILIGVILLMVRHKTLRNPSLIIK